jgi:hypothetical protein
MSQPLNDIPADDEPLLPEQKHWLEIHLVSIRLRQAAWLLMIIYASALIASALPLRLLDPRWYLNAADVLLANAPIAITAACLRLLAHGLFPLEGDSWRHNRIRFQRFCGLMALLYGAVLPVELIAGGLFSFQLDATVRSRLQTLQIQQERITQRLGTVSSTSELNALLPPSAGTGQATASLAQRRATIQQSLANEQRNLSRRLHQERRQRQLNLLINGLRVLLTALATALFFRLLARPQAELLAQTARTLVGL